MDINELRETTSERLGELEKNLRRQIFEARIKNYTNQLDDTASIRRARRDLARVLTVLNELSFERWRLRRWAARSPRRLNDG
jgi:large subunit ribosomal protein L29